MPPLITTLLEQADAANRYGLRQVRAALRLALGGRDKNAPVMAERRDLKLAGPEGDLPARLYRPEGAKPGGPAIIYLHGGGFVIGDLDTNEGLCRRIAAAAGVTLIAVDYRLAPEAVYPAQIEDAVAAARAVIARADELAIDPARIALGGDSAGAYLAVIATAELNREQPGAIAAQMLIYPLIHIDDTIWADSVVRDTRVIGRTAVAYIRSQLTPTGVEFPSLLALDLPKAPPTLIVLGGVLDPVRPDVRLFARRLIEAGVQVTMKEYAPLPHGFANLGHVSPAARRAVTDFGAAMGDLLRWLGLRAAA